MYKPSGVAVRGKGGAAGKERLVGWWTKVSLGNKYLDVHKFLNLVHSHHPCFCGNKWQSTSRPQNLFHQSNIKIQVQISIIFGLLAKWSYKTIFASWVQYNQQYKILELEKVQVPLFNNVPGFSWKFCGLVAAKLNYSCIVDGCIIIVYTNCTFSCLLVSGQAWASPTLVSWRMNFSYIFIFCMSV